MAVALRCIGAKDVAEDIVQESFLRIWHNAAGYDASHGEPLTWMLSITRHLAIDYLRKRRDSPLSDEHLATLYAEQPAFDEQLTSEREALVLRGCLEQLDTRQRTSIRAAFFHGLSYAQLAVQLDEPLGSVKSWIRRGMERLRRCLES